MNWKEYQEQTAKLFRQLGCDAQVDAKIVGARATHTIDVWVRFKRFGLETSWVVECKYWNSPVTKEKLLVLKTVVEDVGADRGILISASGFQSGAIHATKKTNITLTDFEELVQNAQQDLILSLFGRIETRVVELKYSLFNLYRYEQTGPHSMQAKLRPNLDVNAIMHATAKLTAVEFGFDGVRLKKPPYRAGFDDKSNTIITVNTLEEFVEAASRTLGEVEATLKSLGVDTLT